METIWGYAVAWLNSIRQQQVDAIERATTYKLFRDNDAPSLDSVALTRKRIETLADVARTGIAGDEARRFVDQGYLVRLTFSRYALTSDGAAAVARSFESFQ